MSRGRVIRIETIGYRTDLPGLPEARCPQTGKRRFRSREHAERVAVEWAHHNSTEAYAYECADGCGGWHLTRRLDRQKSANHALSSGE